jgi:hypothetical protein
MTMTLHRVRRAGVAALALLSASPALAEFTGFKLENKTWEYDGLDHGFVVFELYANFTSPNDTVVNVFGGEFVANHDFYQPDESSLPSKKSFYDTNGPWDSFVTIGFLYGGGAGNPDGPDAGITGDTNAATLDPSFFEEGFLFGKKIDDPQSDPTKGAGWFNANPTANNIQGKAGTYEDLKVLLGRFTFELGQGSWVYTMTGKISLTYKPNGIGSSQIFDQTFFAMHHPAPAGAMLFVVAGLIPNRRCRKV